MTQWQTIPENVEVICLTPGCLTFFPILASVGSNGEKWICLDHLGFMKQFTTGDYLVKFSAGEIRGYTARDFPKYFREDRT